VTLDGEFPISDAVLGQEDESPCRLRRSSTCSILSGATLTLAEMLWAILTSMIAVGVWRGDQDETLATI
jgi:hypothetical protein